RGRARHVRDCATRGVWQRIWSMTARDAVDAPAWDALKKYRSREDTGMVVSLREFAFVTVGSIVLSLALLAVIWPWARQIRRLTAIGVAVAVGVILWNTALNLTNASSLNVDSPLLGLSVQDVGS